MAMSPTFWLNDVIGETPNTPPEIADMNPSQQRDPETSFSVMSLPRPPVHAAVVSPIVSTADTMNTRQNDIMAPAWNLGLNAKSSGTENTPISLMVSPIAPKSTIPKNIEMTYPNIRPKRTYICFATPFILMWNTRAATSVRVATRRFCHAPTGYLPDDAYDDTPTLRMLSPIATTTHDESSGEMIFLQYFAVRPRIPSKIPPTMMAPTITP